MRKETGFEKGICRFLFIGHTTQTELTANYRYHSTLHMCNKSVSRPFKIKCYIPFYCKTATDLYD